MKMVQIKDISQHTLMGGGELHNGSLEKPPKNEL